MKARPLHYPLVTTAILEMLESTTFPVDSEYLTETEAAEQV